jgi:hypothetical protein
MTDDTRNQLDRIEHKINVIGLTVRYAVAIVVALHIAEAIRGAYADVYGKGLVSGFVTVLSFGVSFLALYWVQRWAFNEWSQ